MIMDGKNRHFIAIKNISRLSSKSIVKSNLADYFCMNCLNGFWVVPARDKHYQYCSGNGHVKVKMSTLK